MPVILLVMTRSIQTTELQITEAEFGLLMAERLPFAAMMGLEVEQFKTSGVWMRSVYRDEFLRPGGTVAGPLMMGLADAAMYAAVLARIGPVELAVTTNLCINFLRRPLPGDVLGYARLLKLGKRLAVGEVSLYSDLPLTDRDVVGKSDCYFNALEATEPVAHVTSTYSIPPPEQRQEEWSEKQQEQ